MEHSGISQFQLQHSKCIKTGGIYSVGFSKTERYNKHNLQVFQLRSEFSKLHREQPFLLENSGRELVYLKGPTCMRFVDCFSEGDVFTVLEIVRPTISELEVRYHFLFEEMKRRNMPWPWPYMVDKCNNTLNLPARLQKDSLTPWADRNTGHLVGLQLLSERFGVSWSFLPAAQTYTECSKEYAHRWRQIETVLTEVCTGEKMSVVTSWSSI